MPWDGANGLLPGRGVPVRRSRGPAPPGVAEPAPGVPGRAGGRLGVGPEAVPPGRGAEVDGRWSCRATGAGVDGRGSPGRGPLGVELRVTGAGGPPGVGGADGAGAFRVDGAELWDGDGGVRVDGAEVSACVRADGADGAGVRFGADGVAGVRVDGADGPGVRVDGPADGRGAVLSARTGADGRGALGVAEVVEVLGVAGAPFETAGADGAGRGVGAGASAAGASFSLRRRITGASRVDEGDLTNSPMSFAIERTALLSTPSSLASS
jgi:hypothetical protein